MRQEQGNQTRRSPSTWFTTRTLVIAFAIVEALAMGAVLLHGSCFFVTPQLVWHSLHSTMELSTTL